MKVDEDGVEMMKKRKGEDEEEKGRR